MSYKKLIAVHRIEFSKIIIQTTVQCAAQSAGLRMAKFVY